MKKNRKPETESFEPETESFETESFESLNVDVWPNEFGDGIDDEAFARAIEEGRAARDRELQFA